MSHQSELIASDIEAYLQQHEHKELLRFLTCGSVDDGKSTLIGRLLHDSKLIYEDQLAAVRRDSEKMGTTGELPDLALLVDGLKAEREQGITIDVAYRYFSTEKRKFIIADTPGHEQYTRNMVTGASTCDLAIILIDARNGITTQTKRHSFLVSLLGIKHIIVAINKMDLEEYSQDVYRRIHDEYLAFAERLEIPDIRFIPMSALKGDNVVERSAHMLWYDGAPLMEVLETIEVAGDRNLTDLRFPVQYVLRPDLHFRGYTGTLAAGIVRPGDEVMALPSGKRSRVRNVVTYEGDLAEAFPPMAITLTLEDELDISRGDMLVPPEHPPRLSNRLDAMVVWMAEEPMVPGKSYLIKQTTKMTTGAVSTLHYQVDVNTLHQKLAPSLGLNEIGLCTVTLTQPIAFDAYKRNRMTGSFILIDRITNGTVGAGMILDPEAGEQVAPWDHWASRPRAKDLHSKDSRVAEAERSARFGQQPATVLITGLTGTGKSTISYALERRLFEEGRAAFVLDGENMRLGISKDLGFSADDRSENVRRAAEVARLMNKAGLVCICAFEAPSEDVRQRAKELIGSDRFALVYLTAPLEVRKQRDPNKMYERAEQGEIKEFPGVSAPYEEPTGPDLVLPTHEISLDGCVDRIVQLLDERGLLAAKPYVPPVDYSI